MGMSLPRTRCGGAGRSGSAPIEILAVPELVCNAIDAPDAGLADGDLFGWMRQFLAALEMLCAGEPDLRLKMSRLIGNWGMA